jgi:ABC-2 type transport system permease protein
MVVRVLRVFALTWWLHLKMLNRSMFDSALQVVWPLVFATVALLVYRAGGDTRVLASVAMGAAVMAVWTAISSTASGILHRERGLGTLEPLVAAPTPFALSILSMVTAVATVGCYSMVATLLWARWPLGVSLVVARPGWFAAAVALTVLSFAVLGFLLSVTAVRYRTAWALGGAVEFPVWLVCGFVVPPGLLPDWLRPLSWLLPPSWGMAAVRAAANGQPVWRDLAVCAALQILYAVVAARLATVLLRSARRHATLALE